MKNQASGLRGLSALTLALAATMGCAHYIMRGSVAQIESADEAQVCLGDHEVKVGDKIALFKLVCIGPVACRKERIGEGAVTRTLNEHMSIVKVAPGVEFKVGTVVEKE